MIVFLTTAEHAYTHEDVVKAVPDGSVRVASYEQVLGGSRLPPATYVFTDVDRLSTAQLGRAAEVCGHLRAAGQPVLNDPARMRSRWGLLRALNRAGINRFDAYRVEEQAQPRRWPVFVRVEGEHDSRVTDLLHDADAVGRKVEEAVQSGVPLSRLLVIEYAAEPVRPGLFRKLSAFRIGRASVAAPAVHDDVWLVKYGKPGIAGDELYADDLRIVTDNPYAAALQRAFDLAGLEYGRADFGIVGGEVQVYEINSNPHVKFPQDHASPLRVEAWRRFRHNYLAALRALDAPAG